MTEKRYKELKNQKESLNTLINFEMVESFPVGSMITYRKNKKLRTGDVIRHSYKDELYIRDTKTGKELWIDLSRLFEIID